MYTTLAVALVLATGCSDVGADLIVDVKTDFVPGIEFVGVRVERDGVTVGERIATEGDDFLTGQRVAALEDVGPAEVGLHVLLLDASSATLAERPLRVRVGRSHVGVTVVITRNCRGVECDPMEACFDAACVDPTCTEQLRASCLPPACVTDDDCAGRAPCAQPRCDNGTCLFGGGACAERQYCDPDVGCRDVAETADAGHPDAGGSDAGRPDAGRLDAGRLDGGGLDAGGPDGGGLDAGGPDAGGPDASVPVVCTPVPLAGSSSVPGTSPPTDGTGAEATFGHASTIRTDRSTDTILVYDAHAIRRVRLTGEVETVLTSSEMCDGGVTGYSVFGVDAAGEIFWLCGGALRRRSVTGDVTSTPTSGFPASVQGFNVGLDDEVYAVGSSRAMDLSWEPFIARVGRDGAVDVVWSPPAGPELSVPTDIAVTGGGLAYVPDPNGARIRRIDLASGEMSDVMSPPGMALVDRSQHLALDARGNLYVGGRAIHPGGERLADFPSWTSQFGIDVIGPATDVIQADCAYVTTMGTGWACEITLFRCP